MIFSSSKMNILLCPQLSGLYVIILLALSLNLQKKLNSLEIGWLHDFDTVQIFKRIMKVVSVLIHHDQLKDFFLNFDFLKRKVCLVYSRNSYKKEWKLYVSLLSGKWLVDLLLWYSEIKMNELGVFHKLTKWRPLINSSRTSLKAVLLYWNE